MPRELSEQDWNRVEELFAIAVNLSGGDRRDFILTETAHDPDIQQQLEKLLENARDGPLRIAKAIEGVARSIAPGTDWTGRNFGPYRIVREVGRGGMGIVFEANRDDHEYRKRVALKIAYSWKDSDLLRERFRNERQILAELEHPNVARFLDGGTEEGLPYFVMEFIEGSPITEYCRQGKRPLRNRIELFRQVCSAVECAHANLIIHRDLKPENVLVTPEGIPKLLDFGIAKLLDAARRDTNDTTGTLLWTPNYASPEQVRGKRVTTRSDVYSLGLILYELLCEERGQVADTSSPLALDRSVCELDPPLPSARATSRGETQLASRLRGDLDTIVATAIRKEPERRYESVAALNEDLRRYLEGEPVLARPRKFGYVAMKFLRRHAVGVVAAALVVTSLTVGASIAILQARRAERRFDEVRKLANTFLFDFHDRIRDLPGSTDARTFVLTTAVRYLDSLSSEAANDNDLLLELAAAYHRIARVQADMSNANLGQTKQASTNLAKAIRLAEQVVLRQPSNKSALRALVGAYSQLGHAQFWDEGNRTAGLASLRKGMDYSDRLMADGQPDPEDVFANVDLLQNLARDLSETEPKDALRYLEKSIKPTEEAVRQTTGPRFRNLLSNTYLEMSLIYRSLGDPLKSVEMLEKSMAISRELLRANPTSTPLRNQVAVRFARLAAIHQDWSEFHLNDARKCVEYYLQAETIQAQLVAEDARNMQALHNLTRLRAFLAHCYSEFDPPKAIRYGEMALDATVRYLRGSPGSLNFRILQRNSLSSLAQGYLAAGDPARSIESFTRSLAISEEMAAATPEDLGALESRLLTQWELAKVHIKLKRLSEAESLLAKAKGNLAPLRKKMPKDLYFLRDEAVIAEAKGDLLAARSDQNGAKTLYRQALQVWEEWTRMAVESPFPKFNRDRLTAKLAKIR